MLTIIGTSVGLGDDAALRGSAITAESLPPDLRNVLAQLLGSSVSTVRAASGLHASDFAAVLRLEDGSDVFVKASTDPERLGDYLTEASIAEHLPVALATPRLRGAAQHAGWVLLWSDALDARHPAQPWTAHDTRLVIDTIERRVPLLTPSPVAGLRGVDTMVGGAFRVWSDLVVGRPRAVEFDDLDAWTREHLSALARLERAWPVAVAGQTLCHFDPRADNYLLDEGGALWTIDWSRACLAAPWVDLATFLVTPAGDGHDPEDLFWSSRLAEGASGLALDAHLAVLVGYWRDAVAKAEGSGSELIAELLDYQQRSLEGAMTWLQRRSSM